MYQEGSTVARIPNESLLCVPLSEPRPMEGC